jgi:hypothetical protein
VAARPDLRSWSDDFNNLYRILKYARRLKTQ